jgi:rhodanese-related sulfurtransferase
MRIKLYLFINSLIAVCLATACSTTAQKPSGMVRDQAFDKTIYSMLDFNVKPISVKEASKMKEAVFLDAREYEEYSISHIPGAIHIGFDHWEKSSVKNIDKEKTLVVYCSVGYRSEKIGKKLQDLGYNQVFNLYGSIFEWANEGLPLVTNDGSGTTQIHTYDRNWSKWISNKEISKVW